MVFESYEFSGCQKSIKIEDLTHSQSLIAMFAKLALQQQKS